MMFVALIQQGLIGDQKVIGVSPDQEKILAEAEREANKLNSQQGFGQGWAAAVLPVE